MKKVVLSVLIICLVFAGLFVSCKNEIEVPADELVSVGFSNSGSRALSSNLEAFNPGDYYWAYAAQKADGSKLVSGQTANYGAENEVTLWVKTNNGVPVKGLGDSNGLYQVPGFSQGLWNFKLYAFKGVTESNSVYTGTDLLYKGETTGVLLKSNATNEQGQHSVNVIVSPVSNTSENGTLVIKTKSTDPEHITMTLFETYTSDAPVYGTDYFPRVISIATLDATPVEKVSGLTGGTIDANGSISLPAGTYKVTFAFADKASNPTVNYARGSVIATVYSNLTTTIKGNLLEADVYAEFGPELSGDVITIAIGTDDTEAAPKATIPAAAAPVVAEPTTVGSSSSNSAKTASAKTTIASTVTAVEEESDKNTSVTIPAAGLADTTVTKTLTEDNGTSKTVTTATTSSTHDLEMTVTTAEAEATSSFAVQTGQSKVAGVSLTLTRTTTTVTETTVKQGDNVVSSNSESSAPVEATITEFNGKYVTVSTYIEPGLSGVSVAYDGTADQPVFNAANANPSVAIASADSTSNNAGTGYNPTTGLVVFKTNHFSSFVVICNDALKVTKSDSSVVYYRSLAAFRDAWNNGEISDNPTVELLSSVDLGGLDWTPIGTSARPFTGVFDGGNKTISNLWISGGGGSSDVGFFSRVSGTTIKNISFVGANVSGDDKVGLLVGRTLGGDVVISGVSVDSTSAVTAKDCAGGLIGTTRNDRTIIKNTTIGASVTSTGLTENNSTTSRAGGFVAGGYYQQIIFEDCTFNGACHGEWVSDFVAHIMGNTATRLTPQLIFIGCNAAGTLYVETPSSCDPESRIQNSGRLAGEVYYGLTSFVVDSSVNSVQIADGGVNGQGGLFGYIAYGDGAYSVTFGIKSGSTCKSGVFYSGGSKPSYAGIGGYPLHEGNDSSCYPTDTFTFEIDDNYIVTVKPVGDSFAITNDNKTLHLDKIRIVGEEGSKIKATYKNSGDNSSFQVQGVYNNFYISDGEPLSWILSGYKNNNNEVIGYVDYLSFTWDASLNDNAGGWRLDDVYASRYGFVTEIIRGNQKFFYNSFEDAYAQVQSGDTIVILSDCYASYHGPSAAYNFSGKNVTIHVNEGATLACGDVTNDKFVIGENNAAGTLTLEGPGKITLNSSNTWGLITQKGSGNNIKAIVKNVTIEASSANGLIMSSTGGNLTVEGGYFKNIAFATSTVIKGGYFTTDIRNCTVVEGKVGIENPNYPASSEYQYIIVDSNDENANFAVFHNGQASYHSTFTYATDALQSGDTLVFLRTDVELNSDNNRLYSNGVPGVTYDLNGHTLSNRYYYVLLFDLAEGQAQTVKNGTINFLTDSYDMTQYFCGTGDFTINATNVHFADVLFSQVMAHVSDGVYVKDQEGFFAIQETAPDTYLAKIERGTKSLYYTYATSTNVQNNDSIYVQAYDADVKFKLTTLGDSITVERASTDIDFPIVEFGSGDAEETIVSDTERTYTAVRAYVCQVGEGKYETLAEGLDMIKGGGEIKLLKNIELTGPIIVSNDESATTNAQIYIDKWTAANTYTVDFNGHTISGEGGINSLFKIMGSNGGTFVFKDSVGTGGLIAGSNCYSGLISVGNVKGNTGFVEIHSGFYDNPGGLIVHKLNITLTTKVYGGKFSKEPAAGSNTGFSTVAPTVVSGTYVQDSNNYWVQQQ